MIRVTSGSESQETVAYLSRRIDLMMPPFSVERLERQALEERVRRIGTD